jgi:hypothetical protein
VVREGGERKLTAYPTVQPLFLLREELFPLREDKSKLMA